MGKSWKNPHKAAAAAKKGKIFTKLAREIIIASKLGGPDPDGNSRLKMAINAARAVSCPKDTIERAIKKGSGQADDGTIIEEITYEGQGPFNIGVIVECQTDNRNRTVSDLRVVFNKNGGQMGDKGSVGWMFDRVSLIEGTKAEIGDPEEEAIEAGANEVEQSDEGYSFYGEPTDLDSIRNVLIERGWEITTAELSYKPKNITKLNDEQISEVHKFLEALDDFDDSHRIHATVD